MELASHQREDHSSSGTTIRVPANKIVRGFLLLSTRGDWHPPLGANEWFVWNERWFQEACGDIESEDRFSF